MYFIKALLTDGRLRRYVKAVCPAKACMIHAGGEKIDENMADFGARR